MIRKSASLTTHMGQLILYSFIVSSLPPPDFQSSVSRGVCLKYEDKCSLFLEADTSIGATIGSRHHIYRFIRRYIVIPIPQEAAYKKLYNETSPRISLFSFLSLHPPRSVFSSILRHP